MQLNGKTDGELVIESNDSKVQTNALYWIENKTKLVSMELPSTTITEFDINDSAFICPCKADKIEKEKVIWCVTSHGAVYLMNRKFEVAEVGGLSRKGRTNLTIKRYE